MHRRAPAYLALLLGAGLVATASFATPEERPPAPTAKMAEPPDVALIAVRSTEYELVREPTQGEAPPAPLPTPAPSDSTVRSSPYADRDRDRLEDALEAEMARDEDGLLQVIVRTVGPLDEPRLRALEADHGFAATSHWPDLRGFAATLTTAQILELAAREDVQDVNFDHPTTGSR